MSKVWSNQSIIRMLIGQHTRVIGSRAFCKFTPSRQNQTKKKLGEIW